MFFVWPGTYIFSTTSETSMRGLSLENHGDLQMLGGRRGEGRLGGIEGRLGGAGERLEGEGSLGGGRFRREDFERGKGRCERGGKTGS